ncbi:hypothetical protein MUP01_02820 [Candidatus Bathyarchaeota archaeon]|nr:hypothetical protein [Candidatus Bathyarchaeota archaeon]
MPKSRTQILLDQAKAREEEYDWLGATDCYAKIRRMISVADSNKLAILSENTGYAFYRAAFQAGNNVEFRKRCEKSIENYEKAIRCLLKSEEAGQNPRKLRCSATIALINYWLASDVTQKKNHASDSWRQAKEALVGFLEKEDALECAKTYNRLVDSVFLAFFLDWSFSAREKLAKEAIGFGERAIASISGSVNAYEEAKALAKFLICTSVFAYNFLDVSDRERQYEKVFSYWSRARRLNQDAAFHEILHPFFGPNIVFGVEGSNEAIGNFKKALRIAEKTSDRFLMGSAFDWLAYHTAWAIRKTEDADKQLRLVEEASDYARNAKKLFSQISFVSPRGDLAWIEDASKVGPFSSIMINETDLRKKRAMLGQALKEAPAMMKRASDSGYPEIMLYAHHIYSFMLTAQSKLETSEKQRKKILEEALAQRRNSLAITSKIQPFMYWNRGVMHNLMATIRSELAELTEEPMTKQSIIQQAIAHSNASLKLRNRDLRFYRGRGSIDALIAQIAENRFFHGNLLIRLYNLTNDRADLERALQSYRGALANYRELAIMSRVAECYWKIALVYDKASEHVKSAKGFKQASKSYEKSAERIPILKDFFEEHSKYMLSWSEIELARDSHRKQNHGEARHHFEKAAQLQERLEHWRYLSPSYLAWAMVEYGEDLSRKDKPERAIRAFSQAAQQFKKTIESIETYLPAVESLEERTMAGNILRGTDARYHYCLARINLEDGRLLDKKGNHAASSKKYSVAVRNLEKIENELEYERDRKEFRFLILVSQAWERMMKAETEGSPNQYKEASERFESSKEFTSNQRSRKLVQGHSQFCRALEIGVRIANAMNEAEYLTAKIHLKNASDHYTKARFREASKYAKATELLFDAYWHIDHAKRESDPEEKADYYMMAEKALQKSVASFEKAKHVEKKEQVAGILRRVREVRELAISLSSLLSGSRIASTRTTLTVPTPSYEEAVGLERFEHADVRANVMVSQKELSVGEEIGLEIELVNVGKGSALLTKIRGVIPEGFDVISKPAKIQTEDNHFNLRGKKLDSLKTEEIELVVRPKTSGVFTLEPVVFYLDENGKYKASQSDQMIITVKQRDLKSCGNNEHVVATGFLELDKLLYGGMAQNSAAVLVSGPNDERASIVRSFLETGLNSEQTTFYLATRTSGLETSAEASRSDFRLFICNSQADAIIGDGSNVYKLRGVENLTEISITLLSALNKLPASSGNLRRRACIDVVSDVLLQHGPINTRKWLNSLIPQLKRKDFTILALVDPEMHSSKDLHSILDVFDGEIKICEKETPRGPRRFLRILRMQDHKYSRNEKLL